MLSTTIVIIVLIMNIMAIRFYSTERRVKGLILKALADGISLIYICAH